MTGPVLGPFGGYDTLNRQTQIAQQGAGGNFVGVKEATLAYDAAGELKTLTDYSGYLGTGYADVSHGDTIVTANLTKALVWRENS